MPHNAPKPLGAHVILTHYMNANLYHDMVTGRSVTGIIHFINQTPIDFFSKKQPTCETATYGSEFVAARICVEQIIDLCIILRFLGVMIIRHSHIFGDNESIVNSSMKHTSKLHKRHNTLSFHRVRESIAAGIVQFHFLPGKYNHEDVLSKNWAHNDV